MFWEGPLFVKEVSHFTVLYLVVREGIGEPFGQGDAIIDTLV